MAQSRLVAIIFAALAGGAASFTPPQPWARATSLSSLGGSRPLKGLPARAGRAPPRIAMLSFPAVPSLAALHAISASIQPWQYFCYLMLAGLGVPLSEDGLALLAGSLLGSFEPARRAQTVAAIYLGVVLSDIETFLIGALVVSRVGKALKRGRLAPLPAAAGAAEPAGPSEDKLPVKGKSGDEKVLRLVSESGQYIGFVARFCVGLRAPIALTCGVLPGVSIGRFAAGAALGGLVTVPIQLVLGVLLRDRVTSPVGLATLCASFYAAGPVTFIVASALLYALRGRGPRASGPADGSDAAGP